VGFFIPRLKALDGIAFERSAFEGDAFEGDAFEWSAFEGDVALRLVADSLAASRSRWPS
jgi:hypothetical protein